MTEMFEQEMLLLGEMDGGHYFWASKVERDKVIKEAMQNEFIETITQEEKYYFNMSENQVSMFYTKFY